MQQIRVLLYGIKGSGLAALALFLTDYGLKVSGYDVEDELFTEKALREREIDIYGFEEFSPWVLNNYDILVYSSAFKDRPELDVAKKRVATFEYHEFVAWFLKDQQVIAIAGTHGKTTLVGMLTQMLADVNVIEGDGYGRYLGSSVTILEACEYQDHFLSYRPELSVITAIELDHTDYFSTFEAYLESFRRFASRSRTALVFDPYRSDFAGALTFGPRAEDDYFYRIIARDQDGFVVDFSLPQQTLTGVALPFYGEHMVKLSLAALAVGQRLGYDLLTIVERLKHFVPVKRRLNISRCGPDHYIDDYAHQPSQIANMYQVDRKSVV